MAVNPNNQDVFVNYNVENPFNVKVLDGHMIYIGKVETSEGNKGLIARMNGTDFTLYSLEEHDFLHSYNRRAKSDARLDEANESLFSLNDGGDLTLIETGEVVGKRDHGRSDCLSFVLDPQYYTEGENLQQKYRGITGKEIAKQFFDEAEVSKKIDGEGYNIFMPRHENETNKQWSARTREIAEMLHHRNDYGDVFIKGNTFNGGRIVADIKPGSDAEAIFFTRTRFIEGLTPPLPEVQEEKPKASASSDLDFNNLLALGVLKMTQKGELSNSTHELFSGDGGALLEGLELLKGRVQDHFFASTFEGDIQTYPELLKDVDGLIKYYTHQVEDGNVSQEKALAVREGFGQAVENIVKFAEHRKGGPQAARDHTNEVYSILQSTLG